MTMKRLVMVLVGGALLIAAPVWAQVSGLSAPPIRAKVDQLAWVAGAWTGTLGARTIEQYWSAPLGGSIIAMYRSLQADRATLYELLAIEQEGDGVVLRIKHFAPGPGLVGQEAKDESMNHSLVSLDGRTAVFEAAAAGGPVRVTFRSPDAAALNITVVRQRDGAPVTTEFKYHRMAPQAP